MGIKTARSAKGISQEALAAELGIDRSAIAKWETGKSLPRAELLPKLADILGCTVDELLRGGEKEVN